MKALLYTTPFVAILLSLQACLYTATQEDDDDMTSRSLQQEEIVQYMQVSINNLRIRSTPDLEGAVLERLRDKTVLEYMEDSTEFTTELKLNGVMYNKPWYKVKSEAGNIGWIYGGCIEFLPDAENKRLMALQAEIEAEIEAAQGDKSKAALSIKAKNIVQTPPVLDDYLLERFRFYLKQIPNSDPNAMSRAAAYFESIFPNGNSPTAEAAFADLLVFHREVLEYSKNRYDLSKYQILAEEIERYGSANMQYDEITQKLATNGLNFGINSKGWVYLKEDIDFLMRRFYRLVSAPTREYFEQAAIENEHPAFEGEQIAIPITELAAYTVFWDKFLTHHPFFALKDKIIAQRQNYAKALLMGTAEQPAFQPKTKVLRGDYQEAYQVMGEQMGQSPFIKAMQKYYKVLENSNFSLNNQVADLRKEILDNLH